MNYGKAIVLLIASCIGNYASGMVGPGIDGHIPADFKGGGRRDSSKRRLACAMSHQTKFFEAAKISHQEQQSVDHVVAQCDRSTKAPKKLCGRQWLDKNIDLSSFLAPASSVDTTHKRKCLTIVKKAKNDHNSNQTACWQSSATQRTDGHARPIEKNSLIMHYQQCNAPKEDSLIRVRDGKGKVIMLFKRSDKKQ